MSSDYLHSDLWGLFLILYEDEDDVYCYQAATPTL